jgi:excisionase family DNA binding protein
VTTDPISLGPQWLTIPEAAQRLGLSIVTVRRRIKQGSLEAELQPGIRGPEYRVRLPSETIVRSAEPEQLTSVVTTLLARLAEIEDQRLAEGKAAAAWQAKAEMLGREVEQLKGRLAALQAPKEEPAPVVPPVEALLTEERPRAAWWRRVLLGE